MNADYLAAKELAAKEREISEKERANKAQEAEKYRSSVAEIRAKDLDRIAKYGAMGAGTHYDPKTGQLLYEPGSPDSAEYTRYVSFFGPQSPFNTFGGFLSGLTKVFKI